MSRSDGDPQWIPFDATIKRFIKTLLWKPARGIHSGREAYIYPPCRVDGAHCISIGERTTIDRNGWLSAIELYAGIRYQPQIILGNDVHIGRYCCLTSIQSIVINSGCLLSEYVYISDLSHGFSPTAGPLVDQPLESKGPVIIGSNTFIGYRASILPGVTLGEHCVVGTNSVVTKSFPSFSMIAGCPARLIKRYCAKRGNWVTVVP